MPKFYLCRLFDADFRFCFTTVSNQDLRTLFLCSILFQFYLGYTQESGVVGATYHDITARYNSYFIAKERILEIEKRILDNNRWNYSAILPIYPQFDTTMSKSLESEITDCIEKASIAIQRHPESRWEDDAYLLVGKARMYESQFPDAIETFKYVNTNGDEKDSRNRALIELLRTFTEAAEYRNAEAVTDFIRREELTEENQILFQHNLAYYYQVRGNYQKVSEHLSRSVDGLPRNAERARIYFVLGQVFQELHQDDSAYFYYKKALKESKTYELTFFTKLNIAQVTQLGSTDNVKKVHRYFKKLLKDQKNIEYRDRIYFEMGDFELKQGNMALAIEHYKSSLAENGKDQRQKSYSYLKLGQIYYDSLRNYELAKAYYDSTMRILDKEHEFYDRALLRQEVLVDFVKYFSILSKNDSLISLSNIPADSLDRLINKALSDQESEFTKEKEKAKKEKQAQRSTTTTTSSYTEANQVLIDDRIEGEWYFYNLAQMSQGFDLFREKWGDRELEDNWRRSDRVNKQLTTSSAKSEQLIEKAEAESEEDASFDKEAERQKLVANIPTSEDQIQELESEIELAHYEIGKIYNLKLLEKENAIYHFNQLVTRFPDSEFAPEVLYQLYLLQKQSNPTESNRIGNILTSNYPETIYAKLVINPNYIEESKALNAKMKRIYERVYSYYTQNQYDLALTIADSALQENPESEYTQYLKLVRAMTLGEKEGVYKFQYELNNFILNNPESSLIEYARHLVKSSEDFQSNLFSASKAIYLPKLNEKHYFMLVYKRSSDLADTARALVTEFIDGKRMLLNTGKLVFNETMELIMVDEFPGKSAAAMFKGLFEKEVTLGLIDSDYYLLIITKPNFEIFYETKDLDTYLVFFEKNYL